MGHTKGQHGQHGGDPLWSGRHAQDGLTKTRREVSPLGSGAGGVRVGCSSDMGMHAIRIPFGAGVRATSWVSEDASPRGLLLGGCSAGSPTCGGRVYAAGWTTMVNTKGQHEGSTQRVNTVNTGVAALCGRWCWLELMLAAAWGAGDWRVGAPNQCEASSRCAQWGVARQAFAWWARRRCRGSGGSGRHMDLGA